MTLPVDNVAVSPLFFNVAFEESGRTAIFNCKRPLVSALGKFGFKYSLSSKSKFCPLSNILS